MQYALWLRGDGRLCPPLGPKRLSNNEYTNLHCRCEVETTNEGTVRLLSYAEIKKVKSLLSYSLTQGPDSSFSSIRVYIIHRVYKLYIRWLVYGTAIIWRLRMYIKKLIK